MDKLKVLTSQSDDIYYNLAYEKVLMDICPIDTRILFLWRNDRCVVLGANQDAYAEVDIAKLVGLQTKLARRSSGGGAVYHDKNNLNFSFISNKHAFDVSDNFAIIVNALKKVGLDAVVSGRNDMTINGSKFSGSAFLYKGDTYLHHGTILVSSDTDVMNEILTVNKKKLISHSVKSVKSRVINICDLYDFKSGQLEELITKSATEYWDIPIDNEPFEVAPSSIYRYMEQFSSVDFLFNNKASHTNSINQRFVWGTVAIHYTLARGIIKDLEIYTDSLDPTIVELAKKTFLNNSLDYLSSLTVSNEQLSDIINALIGG